MKQRRTLCRALLLLLCVCLLPWTVTACSKPPEYAELDARFRELVEASAEINEIFFGDGLPTYERVYDPWESMEVLQKEGEDGKTQYIYYCYITDQTLGSILAYRAGFTQPVKYLLISKEAREGEEAVHHDDSGYYYAVDYTPTEYDWYYSEDDPTDYDYIRLDCGYASIDELKEAAAKVYSQSYLDSIYMGLFDGVWDETDDYTSVLSPRYYEYTDAAGSTYFMKSNAEQAFQLEKYVFDFSTAKIVKPSNATRVTIEVDFYSQSDPNQWDTMKITMALQNGQWFLDSGTY
ncbi:MAG: hypothetical protein IJY42_00200 [Clostridia bacterium]|nr:hypothetical protein [Clostridia bacterium]